MNNARLRIKKNSTQHKKNKYQAASIQLRLQSLALQPGNFLCGKKIKKS
jgi:hypothetical protein